MGSIINRVKQVATYYNTSVVKWEETLGLSPSHFYNIKPYREEQLVILIRYTQS